MYLLTQLTIFCLQFVHLYSCISGLIYQLRAGFKSFIKIKYLTLIKTNQESLHLDYISCNKYANINKLIICVENIAVRHILPGRGT